MKVAANVLVILLSLVLSVSAQQQTTVLHHVYLRSTPSTSNPPIATLRKGQKITVMDAQPTDGFFHVKTGKGQEGWVGATYIDLGMPQPTAELAAPFSATTGCDASLWDHVYNSDRLIVKQQCISVTGTIMDATNGKRKDGMRKEADGDTHAWLKVDPEFKKLLNAGNVSDEEGNLVFEVVCNFGVSQADAKTACPKTYHSAVTIPPVGSHVRIVGSYVQDTNHAKWMEIHPVSKIEIVQ
jgi:hypothetical protein